VLEAWGLKMKDLYPTTVYMGKFKVKEGYAMPFWIQCDANYKKMRPAWKHALRVLALLCPKEIDDNGSIGYICLNGKAAEEVGMQRAALWRVAKRIHALGFLVKVSQGGYMHELGNNVATFFAIPGAPDALKGRGLPWNGRGKVPPQRLVE
jgi:hypothetical protein